MANLNTLELELQSVRERSKKLLAARNELDDIEHLTPKQQSERERIRTSINRLRKDERFLSGRIKEVRRS